MGNKRKRQSKSSRGQAKGIEAFFEQQRKRQHQLEQEAYGGPSPFESCSLSKESTVHADDDSSTSNKSNIHVAVTEESKPAENKTKTETSEERDQQSILGAVASSEQNVEEQQQEEEAPLFTNGFFSRFTNKEEKVLQKQPDLTTDSLIFDPSSYSVETWPVVNSKVAAPYSFLTEAFVIISGTTTRTTIINVLCNMLRVLLLHTPDDVLPAIWLCSNAIGASYKGFELGIGPLVLSKVLKTVSGISSKTLKGLYNDHGDWGDVAYAAKASVRMIVEPKPLRVKDVFDTLHAVAAAKGKGAVETKANLIKRLLLAAKGEQVRYLIRTCVAHLRIGAVRTTVLVALARACVLTQRTEMPKDALVRQPEDSRDQVLEKLKKAEGILKECYAQCPNWDAIVPWLMECGDVGRVFERCGLTVGIPLRPMLGQITRNLSDLFLRLKNRNFVCECKYDGQRAQIHVDEHGNVKIYSRHLEDMTEKYPDIVDTLPKFRGDNTSSFIMDAEIVAVNEQGKILPFQTLSNRGRKNVTLENITIQVCVLAFDLMYLNGESLLRLSFRERRSLLKERFVVAPNKFDFVSSLEASGTQDDMEKVQSFFQSSIDRGCEGLMVKVLDHPEDTVATNSRDLLATYEPDKRVESWMKVKKDYIEGVGDSLDLVPIGAWYGNGRKVGWYSPVLMACYNPDNDTLESVCKCMSGFSDKFYKEMKEFYSVENNRVLQRPRHDYVTDHVPDVWFDATEVWEIRGADITLSPVHKAAVGQVDEGQGLSLRFPRFIRRREDKTIEEATTSETIANLYFKATQRT